MEDFTALTAICSKKLPSVKFSLICRFLSGNFELGRLATDFLADEPDGRSLKTLAYPFHLVSSVAHRFTPTGC
jgi:hypothetical protein